MVGNYGASQFGNNYARTDRDNNFSVDQSFQGDINLGLTQRINLDNDLDTYIVAPNDDWIQFYTSGGLKLAITSYFQAFANFVLRDPAYLLFEPLSGGAPGLIADRAMFYCIDVAASAEMYVQDEAGNDTLLSPHKRKKWNYISRNRNSGESIEIAMEKFMIEHYPEYVKIGGIQLSKEIKVLPNGGMKKIEKIIKFKWYQIIKKHRYKKAVKNES